VTVVDYQTHWYPRSYLESIEGRSGLPRTERIEGGFLFHDVNGDQFPLAGYYIDLDEQLASMAEHGVDVMVSSPSIPAEVAALELAEARETIRLLNEETAGAQKGHPQQFVGLAMLPMQDVDAAIEELDHATGELGLTGVCMNSHRAGEPLADESVLPIFERIDQLGLPLFLHPANRSRRYRNGESMSIERGINWLEDTTDAALSLIFSGTLDACPGLQVIHPHAGGVLPFAAGRMAYAARREAARLSLPFAEYLTERFYVDSCSKTPGALRMAIETYGLDRILLATDYPWQSRGDNLAYVRENVTPEQADAILSHNAPPGLALPGASTSSVL
jgi:aminocarboxymuconate-semialdehyde decarboxylase